jgi:hypothetical protein
MAHPNFHLRFLGCLSLVFCIVASIGCRGKQAANRGEREEIALDQHVTVPSKPVDIVFKDFDNNWRKFVSEDPKLAQPVVGEIEHREAAPEPIITPECVYSDTAKGYVPRITVIWNEAGGQVVNPPSSRVVQVQQPQEAAQPPEMRIDLGLQHDPFTRNYFTSALSTGVSKRFSIPSNSALVSNPEAVRLTGPGLFPQLMSFRTEVLQDAATNRQMARNTVVLQELSEGLSYNMRVSRPTSNQWTTDQQFIFVSPVCPNSF